MRFAGLLRAAALPALFALLLSAAPQPLQAQDAAPQPLGGAAAVVPSGPEGVRALIVARREAKLSSQITARILKIGPEPGMAFKESDALVAFDCAQHEAGKRKTEAAVLAADRTYDSRKKLAEFNSGSKLELDLARAELLRSRAELSAARALVRECVIKAPFPGRVVARMANAYESVTPGTPLIEVVDERDLDARIIAPSRWLVWLRIGQKVEIRIDELERSFTAAVRAIGTRVDPVSQSVEITAGLTGDAKALKPGMSGIALFPEHGR